MLSLGMGRAQEAAESSSPQLRLRPSGGYASEGILARWQGELLQLPKAEVVLSVSLVLPGGGFFFAVTQHKLGSGWRWQQWSGAGFGIDGL